jgi:hypothetical protein
VWFNLKTGKRRGEYTENKEQKRERRKARERTEKFMQATKGNADA